ncbi:uncharacterized protein LOC117572339 [Drosophila albomicans]|uniref:Uncharacterized protein LOC117572339 n=1 Tax=Drosophila albomicans TaxID=7291 RepID=A0A6P8XEZ6_DROAB|nr:uncharacterized protein LOC117572339 [Drosophila albomicans]
MSEKRVENPPLPHELTAEWTVRAQLTFARGGEPVQQEYNAQDPLHPVRVVYKWCTPEVEQEKATAATSFRSTNSSATYADSAFGSPQASRVTQAPQVATPAGGVTAQVCGTRCRSTCNIVVSAVADFLPEQLETLNEPFVYHSKVRAQQLRDAYSQTSDTEEQRLQQQQQQQLKRRPAAYDQRRATTESLMNFSSRRHAEEANTFVPTYSPTPTTPSSTFKSTSLPRIPQLPATPSPRLPNLGEKKPRTVHIDVYCTGSEEDEDELQADADASSSDSEADSKQHLYELDSNSTPQTVLDNEQMLLRHQRISSGALPRRLAQKSPQPGGGAAKQQQQQQPQQLNLGHGITKCSTAEEIIESKQMLFRQHIGDQRAVKLSNLRQKYQRQPSDETQSSSYPNSSRSTMPRDATCSSVSSVLAGDCVDSSWKETDELDTPSLPAFAALTKSDSFEYENSLDRVRIRQMERLWSRQHFLEQPPTQPTTAMPLSTSPHPQLTTITEVQSQRGLFQRSDTLPSESDAFSESNMGFSTYPGRQVHQMLHLQRNRPGFLQFFGPPASPEPTPLQTPPQTAPVTSVTGAAAAGIDPFKRLHPGYRWKSEARDNLSVQAAPGSPSSERSSPQLLSAASTVLRCGSEAPPSTTSATTFGTVMPSPLLPRRFDISRDSPSLASETSVVSGYTQEHLEKTRRFGNVVAMRKPGHHVGPTKNPNCHCESCQRWLAERFQLRGRAFSLGERPLLRRPQP